MPSSFAIGWSPVSRSMIASLRAARPTGPSTKTPSLSGPRWSERRAHRARAARGRRARAPRRFRRSRTWRSSLVAGPAQAARASGRRSGRRSRSACAGRAAPSGRRSTPGRARASRPSRSRSRAAPARSPVRPGRTTSRCQYAGSSAASCSKKRGRIGRGPDEAHVAAEHVPELRQLVELGGPEAAADARRLLARALDELLAEVRAETLFGPAAQRAELEHLEDAAVAAHALAAVEQRPAARRDERERDQPDQRREDEQEEPGDQDVENAQLEVDAPFRRPADERREPLDERVARPRLGSGHQGDARAVPHGPRAPPNSLSAGATPDHHPLAIVSPKFTQKRHGIVPDV